MNKIAIVDLDDTVVDLVRNLINVFNNISGKSLTLADWTSYDVYKVYGITQEEYLNICEKEKILEIAKPIPGARETLKILENRGYKIAYVTARAWHTNAYEVTEAWLKDANFPMHELHIVPLDKSKMEYLKEIGYHKVDLIIDDNPTHIQEYINEKMAPFIFLINQPWNAHITQLNYYRIYHIASVLNLA